MISSRIPVEATAMTTALLDAPEDEAAVISVRTIEWRAALRPGNAFEGWLVGRMAVDAVRAERCTREESAVRAAAARRAGRCWDEDRRLDAEVLARGLARDPRATARKLEATLRGVDWMLDRWRELRAALGRAGGWTVDQMGRALDLLGIPPEDRDPIPPLPPPPDVVRAEIARLEARLAALRATDADDRALAEAGLGPHVEKAVRPARRFERACLKRIEWAWSILKKSQPGEAVAPAPPAPESPIGALDDRRGTPDAPTPPAGIDECLDLGAPGGLPTGLSGSPGSGPGKGGHATRGTRVRGLPTTRLE